MALFYVAVGLWFCLEAQLGWSVLAWAGGSEFTQERMVWALLFVGISYCLWKVEGL